jgi:hypothetical protein
MISFTYSLEDSSSRIPVVNKLEKSRIRYIKPLNNSLSIFTPQGLYAFNDLTTGTFYTTKIVR